MLREQELHCRFWVDMFGLGPRELGNRVREFLNVFLASLTRGSHVWRNQGGLEI